MKHEEKMSRLKEEHEKLLDRVANVKKTGIPKQVKREKLEEAYDKIENEYVFVLKKKNK